MNKPNSNARRAIGHDAARLGQQLIEAREQERARLARELHDDIAQRLAVAAIEIERLSKKLPPSAVEARAMAASLRQDIAMIGSDVHALSHQLHASVVDVAGLATASERLCRQLAYSHDTRIEFTARGVPAVLDSQVTLNLFRILQEATANAFKHAGASRLDVQLSGTAEELQLTVSDNGRGFDVASVEAGLGMITMRERVGLIGGELVVESGPRAGTRIHARVPMSGAFPPRR